MKPLWFSDGLRGVVGDITVELHDNPDSKWWEVAHRGDDFEVVVSHSSKDAAAIAVALAVISMRIR